MATRGQLVRQKKAFLVAFAEYGNVTTAAQVAGCARQSVYNWQEHDGDFAAAYRAAEIQATETLEAEARRRAVEGVTQETPIYYKGQAINSIIKTEYSDTLLIFLLKARAPEKYRENVNVTFEIREQAKRLADELGLDVAEVMAEAERLVASHE